MFEFYTKHWENNYMLYTRFTSAPGGWKHRERTKISIAAPPSTPLMVLEL